jgi:uncharacterized membrane protein
MQESLINLGDTLFYEKCKVKLDTKKKKLKVVKPNQIGYWLFSIYDENNQFLYEKDEDYFNEHFTSIEVIRQNKLNKLIS